MTLAAKLFLWLNALTFIALGVSGLLNPAEHLQPLDIALSTATSLSEGRANYGGMHIGIGLFLLFGAVRESWRRPALVLLALFVGGLAFGRIVSVVADGPGNQFVQLLLIIEAPAAFIAAWLAVRHKSKNEF